MKALLLAIALTGISPLGAFGQTPLPTPIRTPPLTITSPTQTPTPVPTPTPDLNTITHQIQLEQERIKRLLASKFSEIESLKKQIAETSDLKVKIQKTNERLDKLDEFNKSIATSSLNLDKLRYRAGKEILEKLIADSGKLEVATHMGKNLTQYGMSMNPAFSKNYNDLIAMVQGKLKDTDNSGLLERLASKGGVASLLANPYVSMAFSVGSFLVSKFKHSEQPSKVERATDLACVLDYTSKVAPDIRVVQFNLSNLDSQLANYHENMKKRFHEYATAVNLDLTFDQYVEKVGAGTDPLDRASDSFFDQLARTESTQASLAGGSTPPDIGMMRFQIESVKSDLAEYERIQKNVDDFFLSYITILKKETEEASNPACAGVDFSETKTTLTTLSRDAEGIRKDIADRFHLKLLTPSKKVLYGIVR